MINTLEFIKEAHKNQRRKFTNEAFYHHPLAVYDILRSFKLDNNGDSTIRDITLLHDVVEDTDANIDMFPDIVIEGVLALTTPSDCKPYDKLHTSMKRLACAPDYVQNIKVADMIHNIPSICYYDKKYAQSFLKKCQKRLNVLTKADSTIRNYCQDLIDGHKLY